MVEDPIAYKTQANSIVINVCDKGFDPSGKDSLVTNINLFADQLHIKNYFNFLASERK